LLWHILLLLILLLLSLLLLMKTTNTLPQLHPSSTTHHRLHRARKQHRPSLLG
jgi:hypothetical protein